MSILLVVGYALVGAIIYVVITYKTKLIEDVFGKEIINKIKNKLKLGRVIK